MGAGVANGLSAGGTNILRMIQFDSLLSHQEGHDGGANE